MEQRIRGDGLCTISGVPWHHESGSNIDRCHLIPPMVIWQRNTVMNGQVAVTAAPA